MSTVRVRYAPSPTGIPHIGNIRTALFDYLIAKKNNGDFILRLEDTDQKRIVPKSTEKIKQSLTALGIVWNRYFEQSKRLDIYRKYLEVLKEKGVVYEDEKAWRFKVAKGEKVSWQDMVYGEIEFQSDVIEDFVIVKSDGYPTYHFASVIDDHEMEISHVVRGEEWISSTPKHLLLYRAFSWSPPLFVHLPTIFGHDKKKLSKREGAKSVFEYLEDGFLPEAIVNYLALLGWAPLPSVVLSAGGKKEQEIFSLDDLIKHFSIDRINKSSPTFSLEKLKWFNSQWIKNLPNADLSKRIHDKFPKMEIRKIEKIAPIVKERIFTINDFENLTSFFFTKPQNTPLIPVSISIVIDTTAALNKLSSWTAEAIKGFFNTFPTSIKIDRIALITTVRNIVSGKEVTPPLYESLEILGKPETIDRLRTYVAKQK